MPYSPFLLFGERAFLYLGIDRCRARGLAVVYGHFLRALQYPRLGRHHVRRGIAHAAARISQYFNCLAGLEFV